jgi:hypothetical protein
MRVDFSDGESCILSAGRVSLLAAAGGRLVGTFSGTGFCTALGQNQDTTAFSTTDGVFDVPLLAGDPRGGAALLGAAVRNVP